MHLHQQYLYWETFWARWRICFLLCCSRMITVGPDHLEMSNLSTNRLILLSVGADFVPMFGRLSPGFWVIGIQKAQNSSLMHTTISHPTRTSILPPIAWSESRQMLRQTSCVQLATRSPIIQAILWQMAPAVVTRALMVTARILMRMVRNAHFVVKPLAHCSSFRIRRGSCHRGLFNVLF